eukprot:CAMPEP_0182914218 /NCGR_PEP_ID=MMETSP0034_2-20130328/38458_1 /TAXON_ID=156128 /ORGANISM="Nephroselmis pyriformis, Strain CCMP717" /LENGTH=390 /DNA_ID=CAMNT_0025050991 /DNA_START=354 /DNA_END=1526 /DNA_ORIENTATION=-
MLAAWLRIKYPAAAAGAGAGRREPLRFLSTAQALADYAALIQHLKSQLGAPAAPVVAFGGSYGGMLAAWLRIKYPAAVTGAIAASAPIFSFDGEDPAIDPGSYAKGVTFDAGASAGAASYCAPNMRAAWQEVLYALGSTPAGRARLSELFRLCPYSQGLLTDQENVWALAYWAQSAFDFMAMGNYPYPSSYILNGAGVLPPYPMRAACGHLAEEGMEGEALVEGLREAAGVFYNHSGDATCYNYTQGVNEATSQDGAYWDFQWCTEMHMPMSRDGKLDMFWPQPYNFTAVAEGCWEAWGVTPQPMWATVQYGGKHLAAASNIVFSNGDLDPWAGVGVLESPSSSVVAVVIKGGAHHLDLFWSHPSDPKSVLDARALERAHIEAWVSETKA